MLLAKLITEIHHEGTEKHGGEYGLNRGDAEARRRRVGMTDFRI